MNRTEIDNTIEQFRSGDLSRRAFMRRATSLGLSAAAAGMLANHVGAQVATPDSTPVVATPDPGPGATPVASPVGGTGEIIRSITREEAQAQIDEAFPFEEPQNEGGQLIHTMTTDISTVNTVLAQDLYSVWVTGFMYDQLVEISPVDGQPVPTGLADSWEIAEDGITYTLKLREGVLWHDGEPFTADDVIFTFDMALAEDSQSVRKGTVESVLASYEKVDDHTVRFVALEPSAIFLTEALGQFGIMPQHIWESSPAGDWPNDPGTTGQDPSRVVGTGPFRFVEWVQGDHVTLEKNAEYWDERNIPVIDTYTYQVLVDPESTIASLQTGATDLIEVPFAQATQVREANPDLQIIDYDTLDFNFYIANQDESRTSLFTDVRLRQALHYALDRDLIAETVFGGFAIRADGTQPVLSIAYDPERINTIYTYDPETAVALLEEAGWVAGADGIREKDGQRLSFECTYSEGYPAYLQQIPYMQQAWRDVGVEMLPAAIPFPTLLENINAGNFEMTVLGFGWDPDGGQDIMFGCDMTPPTGYNWMHYCNEEYDALIEPSKTELDQEARVDVLIEQSNIVNDEMAVGITVFLKDIYGASPRVRNFFPNGYSTVWWLTRAWLAEA